jgi:hypothetical protein
MPAPPGLVVAQGLAGRDPASDHEAATLLGIAGRIASIKGYDFAGTDVAAARRRPGPVYWVPSETVIGVDVAASFGMRGQHDLFGGVVPHPFVATKSITHPLVSPQARAPDGWSHGFARRLGDAVLDGFSAFSRSDAREAARRLLVLGPTRVKRVLATGGHGQSVITTAAELDDVLDAIDDDELSVFGVVLEQDLDDVTTFSFGTVNIGENVITYFGTQRLTPDNDGAEVYGGSDLLVVRGGADALLRFVDDDDARTAIDGARHYDEAVDRCFAGFFASRRNYDIVFGRDAQGAKRHGVLEQSWRIGGASGAEVAALEMLRARPDLPSVKASTVELFGESPPPPPQAVVYFRGVDARVGSITKYAVAKPNE